MLEKGNWSAAELTIHRFERSHKLIEELQFREADLDNINGNFTLTGFINELFLPLFKQNLDDRDRSYVEWFLSYSSEIDGFTACLVLLPVVCVYLTQLLLKSRPPIYEEKEYDNQFHNVPIVPLIFLQQTVMEKVLRRARRNTIEWYASKFVVRVSDNLLYLNDLTVPIVPPEEVRNPWKSIRIVNKFNVLFHRSRESSAAAAAAVAPRNFKEEHHEGYQQRRARKGSWRSLGAGKGDSRIIHPRERSEFGTSMSSFGNASKTATVNLLDEAYATWKEQLQVNPANATEDAHRTVDEYSVFNHHLMRRGKSRKSRKSHHHPHVHHHHHPQPHPHHHPHPHPHARASRRHSLTHAHSRTRTQRRIDLEDQQMDKELAFSRAEIDKMVENEEKHRKSRKHLSRGARTRASTRKSHLGHDHGAHAHPPHARSATTIGAAATQGEAPAPADADADGGPRAVQFHEHANIRHLHSSIGHYDAKEPIRGRTPEQIASLHKFLESRLSRDSR